MHTHVHIHVFRCTCMQVHMKMCVCVCAHVCAPTHAHVYTPDNNLGVTLKNITNSSLKQNLSLVWSSPIRLEWLASEPQGTTCVCPQPLRLQAWATTPWWGFLCKDLGIKLGFLHWKTKVLYHPCPQPSIWDQPASVSHMLGLKACVTTHFYLNIFFY